MQEVLSTLRVALGTQNTRFSAAVSRGTGQISVTGTVKGSSPYLVRIGSSDVDLLMEGIVMLVRQVHTMRTRMAPSSLACISTLIPLHISDKAYTV